MIHHCVPHRRWFECITYVSTWEGLDGACLLSLPRTTSIGVVPLSAKRYRSVRSPAFCLRVFNSSEAAGNETSSLEDGGTMRRVEFRAKKYVLRPEPCKSITADARHFFSHIEFFYRVICCTGDAQRYTRRAVCADSYNVLATACRCVSRAMYCVDFTL